MTEQNGTNDTNDLIDLAVPYALHAVSEEERAEIETRLGHADLLDANAFYDEVRAAREAMAALAQTTAQEPPASLRQQILDAAASDNVRTLPADRSRRWRATLLVAAAAVVIGAVAVGVTMWPSPQPSTAEQVFAAPDVRTVSGDIPAGGTATVVFSRDRHAGVLVMNNVPPPSPGTVYQMWLVSDEGSTSAGTMDAEAVRPSTTAVLADLRDSKALAFTVEPGTGSTQPTGEFIAELPLS